VARVTLIVKRTGTGAISQVSYNRGASKVGVRVTTQPDAVAVAALTTKGASRGLRRLTKTRARSSFRHADKVHAYEVATSGRQADRRRLVARDADLARAVVADLADRTGPVRFTIRSRPTTLRPLKVRS